MRRISALLLAAGLATAPTSAVAGPSHDPQSTQSKTVEAPRGRLGVALMSLTPELRAHFGAPADRGVLVGAVEPGSPAAAAGIAVGDVIVGVGGHEIASAADVHAALASVGKGQRAKIELVRDRQSRSVEPTLTTPSSSWLDWMRKFVGQPVFGLPFVPPLWVSSPGD